MSELVEGVVRISIPDHITIPERAGKMTPDEVARLEKARKGIGLVGEATAQAVAENATRLPVPGVDVVSLKAMTRAAEDIDRVIENVEAVLVKLRQANALLDAEANEQLRKVMAFVRAQEKFDAGVTSLVQPLVAYFANTRAPKAPG